MLKKEILKVIGQNYKDFQNRKREITDSNRKFDKEFKKIKKSNSEFSKQINSDIERYLK